MASLNVCKYKPVRTCDESGVNARFALLFAEVCYLKNNLGSSYTLPIASNTLLGGIKVGPGLSINPFTGVLTAINGAKPIKGTVDGGTVNDPVSGLASFQHDSLVGIRSDGKLRIFVDDVPMSSWGQNAQFTFDNSTGTITFTLGYLWQTNSSVEIPLIQ